MKRSMDKEGEHGEKEKHGKKKRNMEKEEEHGKGMSTTETKQEESRVVLMGILVEDTEATARINGILHEYGRYIVGRMGLPYREKQVSVISIVMDAPQSVANALSGKLGMIPGVTSKCLYGKK